MVVRYLVGLFLFLQIHLAVGQRMVPFNPNQPLDQVSAVRWSSEDGLSSNNLTSFFQSQEGLVWLTSFNGFMSFDGRVVELFDRNNLSFLETDGFYAIVQTVDSTLLFASQGSGIVQYKKGVYSTFSTKKGSIPKSIRTLLKTRSEKIYVGTNNAGLHCLEGDSIYTITYPGLNESAIMSMVEDANGTIWIATDGSGLFSWREGVMKRYTTHEGLLINNVLALQLSKENELLIGTTKGLQALGENEVFHTLDQFNNKQINTLWVDEWNSIWAGTEFGLVRYNEASKTYEELLVKGAIDFVRITSIKPDTEGNIWLTSNRSGLIRLKETNISNLSTPSLSSDRVNIIKEDVEQVLYIGTDLNVLNICENSNCRQLPIKSLSSSNGIRDIYLESKNSFWLATYSGIIHVVNGVEKVYGVKEGMPAEDFRVIHKDKNGNFWFGSRSGGLVKFRDGKILDIFNKRNGLQSNYVLAIAEDDKGSIYVGTHSGGLSIISPNESIVTFLMKEDDAGILLFNIDIDKEGKVWVMANIGPAYFDGNSLRPIKLQSDRRSKTYFDWVDDERGKMLITTNIGIIQVRKEDLYSFLKGAIQEVPITIFDESHGMANQECTGATRSTLSPSGTVYIPTLGGVYIVAPLQQREQHFVPPVRIAHFKTDALEQNVEVDHVQIEPGTLRYSFRFSVLSYSAPDQNQCMYKLEGFDKEWSPALSINEVEYTNLPPGKYTFKVMGCNDTNTWNEVGASYSFQVKPFFYQTVWFYLVLFLGIASVLFAFYKWRISLMKRQNEALTKVNTELDRFVYSASHDLRSPLSSLLGLIHVAREDEQWDKQEYLNLMEKSVKRLDMFISDIIDFSRNARLEVVPEKIDFDTLIAEILEDLRYVDNFEKIEKKVDVNVSPDYYADRKRLRIILINLIANAIKHHIPESRKKPFVSILIKQEGSGVKITISDNGPGIKSIYLKDIFKMFFRATNRSAGSGLGLYIVQETVSKLGGEVSVQSQEGEGTQFVVKLPTAKRKG